MRWLGILLAAGLLACEPVVTPSSSPSPTLSPSQAASPSPVVPREETARALLTLAYAPPSVESVGATATRVGGISPRGPASLAVDESDRIYIWDQARLRVVVYEAGKFLRAIPLPYVERSATALLVDGDRLYLRAVSYNAGTVEYEIDATTGALLRAITDGSLYPRRRTAFGGLPAYQLGQDATGLQYIFTFADPGHIERYERHDAGGALLAYAIEPLPLKGLDAYVRGDGSVYELAADFGGVGSVYVYALLGPSAAARPPGPAPAAPTAPVAFGRPVPDRLTATLPGASSMDLDVRLRTAVWRMASLAKERTDLVAPAYGPLFVARWNDGSSLDIVADASLLFAGGKIYVGPASGFEQLVSYELGSPSRLAGLAAGGATIRIPDLPGVQRSLTIAEIAQLRASLSKGFSVSEGELPFTLEDPFPLYEIQFGRVVVRLRGDDYGAVGNRGTGAFVHDGTLDDFARRWLPVPALGTDDPRSLFLADRVSFEQPGYSELQDISRWKASLVRALNGESGNPQSPEPAGESPATLVFRFPGGRVETVIVSPGSFTYRGRVIVLPGVMYLVYYRGVP